MSGADPGASGERRSGIDVPDCLMGLAVVAGCVATATVGADYGIGTPRRMGPGFFPVALSAIGAALGLAIMIRSIRSPGFRTLPVSPRRLLFTAAAIVLFAVAIEPLGLLVTVFATAVLAAAADPRTRWHEALALGAGLSLALWLIFVVFLGLGVPVLPGG